jgi:phosphatidylserine/phosphatidylglycerophosphate/cardiolipin synthase-like enzyme
MKISVKKFQSHLLTTMHSKSLVIDGKKVLITGANYQARNHGQLGCFDLGFIFEGDIADATRGNFISCWESSHAMRYEGSDIQLDLQKKKYRLESQNDKYIPIILAARKSSNLSQLDCVQNMAFQSAFDHSKRNINILTPNLNDPFIIDCIVQALRRGVCIKIILSKNFNDSRENNIIAGGTNDTTVKNLYFNFARYKNHLQIKWYANKKGQVIIGSSANSSHAKYASFDNEVAIIGSANLDKQSIRHARELNFVVGHKTTVLEWDQIMYQKVFDRSKNID